MREIIINENDASQRLDKFLMKFMPKLPQSMLYKSLRKNCVRVNGKHIRDGAFVLSAGDRLSLYFKDEFFSEKARLRETDIYPDIVYEDENILLINKAAGIVVHADDRGTERTLIDSVKAYLNKKGEYNPESEHSFSPALCNRLDRNTSGLIIAAKNAAALRAVNEKIRDRQIRKLYLCVTDGRFKIKSQVLVSYLTRHEKRVSVSDTPDKNSKPIRTAYSVIAQTKTASLIEVELLTGRTHQIRAQLAAIGHPLSGDVKYGGSSVGGGSSAGSGGSSAGGGSSKERYKLCSYKLRFDFKPDGGILDYLAGREFAVSPEFAKSFSEQKS